MIEQQNILPTRCEKIHPPDAQSPNWNPQINFYHKFNLLFQEGTDIRWLFAKLPKLYVLPYWLNDWTAVWRFLGTTYKAVGEAAIQCTTKQHQEAHMPAKGMLQWVAVMQPAMIEFPLMEMTATSEHENRNWTW